MSDNLFVIRLDLRLSILGNEITEATEKATTQAYEIAKKIQQENDNCDVVNVVSIH